MATSTPWGKSQHSKVITRGIVQYMTASHGGLHVSAGLNALVPDYMRNPDGWYEEDCEWAKPIVALYGRVKNIPEETYKAAVATLKGWHWEAFERFFATVIPAGESYTKDEAAFKLQNRNNFVVTAAFGDWAENVPPGMVGVIAKRASDNATVQVLLSKEEYSQRGIHGFVIDLNVHRPW